MRCAALAITLACAFAVGCGGSSMAPENVAEAPDDGSRSDGFRAKIRAGCDNKIDCDALEREARERKRSCAWNTFGRLPCGEAQQDLVAVFSLQRKVAQRDRARAEADVVAARESERRRHQEAADRRDAERAEREARRERAAWLALDLDGCSVRGERSACSNIAQFINVFPASAHLDEAAAALKTGRARAAELDEARRKEAEAAAAEAEQAPPPRAGVVCCCDGTVSKTCRTPRSGCCSSHGGVCACR